METSNTMRRSTRTIAEHLAMYLQQSEPRAKTMIFCVNNEHAAEMRAELQRACAAWLRPDEIVRVVDDDGSEGKLALDSFCSVSTHRPVIVTTSKSILRHTWLKGRSFESIYCPCLEHNRFDFTGHSDHGTAT